MHCAGTELDSKIELLIMFVQYSALSYVTQMLLLQLCVIYGASNVQKTIETKIMTKTQQ